MKPTQTTIVKKPLSPSGRRRSQEVAEITALRASLAAIQLEIGKHLSAGNENVRVGDVVASIRDLAQIAVSNTGNFLELSKQYEALAATLAACRLERGRLVEESVELLQSERKLQARVETLASERKALTARLTASEAAREGLQKEVQDLQARTAATRLTPEPDATAGKD